MPFVSIINAAITLAGGAPASEDEATKKQRHARAELIARELELGAALGKINATRLDSGRITRLSTLDFDDAKHFIVSRGLLLSELKPGPEGIREKQMRLLEDKARELQLELKRLEKGQLATLKHALQADEPGLFSNFDDIWKYAKAAGIGKPVRIR